MDDFNDLVREFGTSVTVYRGTTAETDYGGESTVTYATTGATTAVVDELDGREQFYAGGMVGTKAAVLMFGEQDGAILNGADFVRDSGTTQVWRVVGEPAHKGNPIPHWEVRAEQVIDPPVEVQDVPA